MQYTSDIFEKAAAILGGMSASRAAVLRELARTAEQEFTRRLREDADPAAYGEALVSAAAVLAAAMYLELSEGQVGGSFKVGDVSVSGAGTGNSGSLRRLAEAILSPYTRDDGFEFRGVPG